LRAKHSIPPLYVIAAYCKSRRSLVCAGKSFPQPVVQTRPLAPRQHLLSRKLRRILRRLAHCFRNHNKTRLSALPKLGLMGDALPKLSETLLLGLSLVNLLARVTHHDLPVGNSAI